MDKKALLDEYIAKLCEDDGDDCGCCDAADKCSECEDKPCYDDDEDECDWDAELPNDDLVFLMGDVFEAVCGMDIEVESVSFEKDAGGYKAILIIR